MENQSTSDAHLSSETPGWPQRSSRPRVGAVLSFDLAREISALQQEESWQHSDRNARTLVEEPSLRIVLTLLKGGARIREHHTDRPVVIQTLQGYVRVESPDETIDLLAGRLMTLQPGVPHDLEAIELSAFLLTIA
jgi:quercetin dioxygenase-like cupin family protein